MEEYEILHDLEDILDPSPVSRPVVDIEELRRICIGGLPDDPSWMRPRAWKLLLALLHPDKRRWDEDEERSRSRYWALVDGIADTMDTLPMPTRLLSNGDRALSDLAASLPNLPFPGIHSYQDIVPGEPEHRPSGGTSLAPLSQPPMTSHHRNYPNSLLQRLEFILSVRPEKPELSTAVVPPTLTVSAPEDLPSPSTSGAFNSSSADETDATSKGSHSRLPHRMSGSQRRSLSVLRLVHTHISLHPSPTPVVAPILPLAESLYSLSRSNFYSVTDDSSSDGIEDVDDRGYKWDDDVEADAFWFLEGIRDRFGEIWQDPDTTTGVVESLSRRLSALDEPLAVELAHKSLDPATSQFSTTWLTSLLAASLPAPALYSLYDMLFSLPETSCTAGLLDTLLAMLVLLRPQLVAVGRTKGQSKTRYLWGGEEGMENEEVAKREGESMLSRYPIEAVGVHRILRAASEIRAQREWTEGPSTVAWAGDVLKSRAFRRDDKDGDAVPGWMDGVKGFTKAVSQSDTLAAVSKVSTNWRAAAVQALTGSSPSPPPANHRSSPSITSISSWGSAAGRLWRGSTHRKNFSSQLGDDSPSTSTDWGSTRSRDSMATPDPGASNSLFSGPVGWNSTPTSPENPSTSPHQFGRPVPSLGARMSSIIGVIPPSTDTKKQPPPRQLMLTASARPPSSPRPSSPRPTALVRHESVSSTASRKSLMSPASDSEGSIVRLRPRDGQAAISPRSPVGLMLKRKLDGSESTKDGETRAWAVQTAASGPAFASPTVSNSFSPLRRSPDLGQSLGEATDKWSVTEHSAAVSRSSSTSSLASIHVPSSSVPQRRTRRMAEKKPVGLRIRDPKRVTDSLPSSPSPVSSDRNNEGELEDEHHDSLLPYARTEEGERTPLPLTPRPATSAAPRADVKKRTEPVFSDEEGAKADEEDNVYGDLLSAYEDDDLEERVPTGSRRS